MSKERPFNLTEEQLKEIADKAPEDKDPSGKGASYFFEVFKKLDKK